jgi:hypothetical protein
VFLDFLWHITEDFGVREVPDIEEQVTMTGWFIVFTLLMADSVANLG